MTNALANTNIEIDDKKIEAKVLGLTTSFSPEDLADADCIAGDLLEVDDGGFC